MDIEIGSFLQFIPFFFIALLAVIAGRMFPRQSKNSTLVEKEDVTMIAYEAGLLFSDANRGDENAIDEIRRMVDNPTWRYYGVITLNSKGIPTIQKNKHENWTSSGSMPLPLFRDVKHEESQ
jgi:uncharacterized membrane protein